MTKKGWKSKIKRACKAADTYQSFFDLTIDQLAGILEKIDQAEADYIASGAQTTITITNNGGSTNVVKNPALRAWEDLNRQATQLWRELGLTPASLKKINEDKFAKTKDEKRGNSLIELLRQKQAADRGNADG